MTDNDLDARIAQQYSEQSQRLERINRQARRTALIAMALAAFAAGLAVSSLVMRAIERCGHG